MIEKLLIWMDKQKSVWRIFAWIVLLLASIITLPVIIFFYIAINQSLVSPSFSLIILCSWSLLVFVLVHELGHLYLAKFCRVPTHGIIFLPIFGAAAIINKEKLDAPLCRWKDYLFSAGGSIASLAVIWLVSLMPCPTWLSITILLWGFISLFNLLPIYPYDGGRMFLNLIAGFGSKATLISRLVGFLTIACLSVINFSFCGWHLTVFLVNGLLWLHYLGLLKAGRIAAEDKSGQPMNIIELLISIIVYLGLITGFLYVFIQVAGRIL